MPTAVNAVIARQATAEQKAEWLAKQGVMADADGVFTTMPSGGEPPATPAKILENVTENAKLRDVPNLHPREYTSKIMVYVGGGPTLKNFLDDVKRKCEDERYDVYTSNKTAAYLLSKGIKPNYHIIIDPQPSKVKDLNYEEEIDLLLGLQCDPSLFAKAKESGKRVTKFLAASVTNENGQSDREAARSACHDSDPQLVGIGGGSMTGTRMIYFSAVRGYRRLEYYGFDGHVEMGDNKVVHCYSYFKVRGENILETEAANGRKFHTTLGLLRQGEELVELLDVLPGLDVEIYGDSLLSNQLALYRQARPQIPARCTPEYLEMQRALHSETTTYGIASKQHAPKVFMAAAQVHRKLGACAVLDYGSGPGVLVKSINGAFPAVLGLTYAEYDPAYPGKDAEPAPADVVFCGDVLEHVEVECTDAVIQHLSDLTRHLLIVVVALAPAKKSLPDGRNAHICLQKADWWLSKLRRHFIVVEQEVTTNYLTASLIRFPK